MYILRAWFVGNRSENATRCRKNVYDGLENVQCSTLARPKKTINIHEIRNPNNETIKNPNICYFSQQLDSTKLIDIIIMSINSKVLHITSFT